MNTDDTDAEQARMALARLRGGLDQARTGGAPGCLIDRQCKRIGVRPLTGQTSGRWESPSAISVCICVHPWLIRICLSDDTVASL